MKNIFTAFILIAFVGASNADDFTQLGVSYTDYDVNGFSADSIDIGYGQQNGKLRYGINVGRLDAGGSSETAWSTGIDYGFGDWEAGTFYVGLGYTDSGSSDGDGIYDVGYRRSSSSGTNYYISIVDCFDDCGDQTIAAGVSFDVGSGNWLGLGYATEDDVDAIQISYNKKW